MNINASRLKAIWLWLAEARYAWLSTAVICIALVISLRPQTTEPVIRLTGLVLQLLGVVTVIWGISETRTLFGHPSFSSKTRAWLSRFPFLRRNGVAQLSGVTCTGSVGKVRAYGINGPGDNPSIESRLEALEKNITSIHERISQTQREMDEEFQKTAAAFKREEQSRQATDNTILVKLEATGTGGVHISAIGALLLFVGVVLSTAALEIASLLSKICWVWA